ncbi:hypothetical protein IWW36_000773 [Coemansia brasiliensis]|uniref:Uncharacterized protein n=1 Tax=Coemansia brasiliensis TaxID=2650707 RepID=A0A9W8IA65_9FUNG|nr:hypothetical protein IWW36_000773 [Coemansia brasiliensis]
MVYMNSNRHQTYRHLTNEQASSLNQVRSHIDQLENTYSGYLLLAQSEYCLLLPLLNPLVIIQNKKHLKRLCKITDLPKEYLRKMQRNLWLQSAIGFVPIANIIFARKFKCSTRNLNIFEQHLQREEDKLLFMQSTDNSNEDGLPVHITRLFNKCPVVKREQAANGKHGGRKSRVTSLYYTPYTSLSDLADSKLVESIRSKQSNDSVASTAINCS